MKILVMQHSRTLHKNLTMRGHLPEIPTKHSLPFNFFNYQTVQKPRHCNLSVYQKKDWKYLRVKYQDLTLAWENRYYYERAQAPPSILGAPGKAVCLILHSVPAAISSVDFCILLVTAPARGRDTDLYIAMTMTLTCKYLLKTCLVFSSLCAATLHHCTGGEQSLFSFPELLSPSIAVKRKKKKTFYHNFL